MSKGVYRVMGMDRCMGRGSRSVARTTSKGMRMRKKTLTRLSIWQDISMIIGEVQEE